MLQVIQVASVPWVGNIFEQLHPGDKVLLIMTVSLLTQSLNLMASMGLGLFTFCCSSHLSSMARHIHVCWFSHISEEHDEDTGMWMVQPEVGDDGSPSISMLHIDCIFRAAHLLPIYGVDPIGLISPDNSLDVFPVFYVNKYIDHHAFQISS